MKILLACEGETLQRNIAKRFGDAPNYLIYNTETTLIENRENQGHDDSHSNLIDLVQEGVSTFVVGNIGPHAFSILHDLQARVLLARGMVAADALKAFLQDELKELSEPTLKKSIHDHEH